MLHRVFVLAISDFAGGTRGQRAVQVKPWAGRKMGGANGMGIYLILTQNPNANSFPDTEIKPGRYFVVHDCRNPQAREKPSLRLGGTPQRRPHSYL